MNDFSIEPLTSRTVESLARLCVELWPDSTLQEEVANGHAIVASEKETAYLVKIQHQYVAFLHLTLRFEYVEGADDLPVAYVEGIYVKAPYRHLGVGRKLIEKGEEWARQKGCMLLASDTEVGNEASIEFHAKSGFEEANRVVCFVKLLGPAHSKCKQYTAEVDTTYF